MKPVKEVIKNKLTGDNRVYEKIVYKKFLDLAELVQKTTKISSILTDMGATGKNLQEKAHSIQDILPDDFRSKIIQVSTTQIEALRDDWDIEQIEEAIHSSDEILVMIDEFHIFKNLKDDVKKKVDILHNADVTLDKELNSWIEKLSETDMKDTKAMMKEKDEKLQLLNSYMFKHNIAKMVIILGSFVAFALLIEFILLLLGYTK